MRPQHRVNRIPSWAWATLTVAAVIFSFWWSDHTADLTLQKTEKRLERVQDSKEPLAERVEILEEYVALCKETPKACRQVPDPDEIKPRVIQAPGPTLGQIRAVALPILTELVSDRIRRDCGRSCEGDVGESGEPGTDGERGPAGAQGPPGKDAPIITSITCTGMTAPAAFTFTFSDGTTHEVECQMLPPAGRPRV